MNSSQRKRFRDRKGANNPKEGLSENGYPESPKVHIKGLLPRLNAREYVPQFDMGFPGFCCDQCPTIGEHCYPCSVFHDFLVGSKTTHFLSSVREQSRKEQSVVLREKKSWWKVFTTL